MDREVFNKWKRLDGVAQCDTVIAYLEDENFGYIVKEYFKNGVVFHFYIEINHHHLIFSGLGKVIDKTLEAIKINETKLCDPKYWWEIAILKKELNKLNRLLEHLFTSLIDAIECLRHSDCISMNLHGELKSYC